MRIGSRLLALALITFAAACGDDGGGSSPDAAEQPDAEATPDAGPECVTATFGEQDIVSSSAGLVRWGGPVTPDLGDGGEQVYQIQFYSGLEDSLVGTFDLAEGIQGNFETCAICVLVFTADAEGAPARTFFQSGGSITTTVDPFTGEMLGTVTGLQLVEVTIDPKTFVSTPVPGGACLDHDPDPLPLDADLIPNAWTCDEATYDDGANCDCGCGIEDPDCEIVDAPVVGCDKGDLCVAAECTATCDVLTDPPVGCTTGTCGFYTADEDICYGDPAVVDAAAIGEDCGATTTFCAVSETVALGVCDGFVNRDDVCREACDENADCEALDECIAIGGIAPKGVCVTPPANDTCGTATPIVVGTPVSGSTGGGTADYADGLQGATCTNFSQPGIDVAYQLVLAAETEITVTLSDVPPGYDPSIALVGPGLATICDAEPIDTCVAGSDSGFSGEGETFTYTAAAGTYFIIVDTFSTTGTGSFTLSVTAP